MAIPQARSFMEQGIIGKIRLNINCSIFLLQATTKAAAAAPAGDFMSDLFNRLSQRRKVSTVVFKIL